MADRKYDSEDGEFVDFETLDDWQERDKAKDAEIKRLLDQISRADVLASAVSMGLGSDHATIFGALEHYAAAPPHDDGGAES